MRQHVHYGVDTAAVSFPHTPESRLSTNVPYLHDITHKEVKKHNIFFIYSPEV